LAAARKLLNKNKEGTVNVAEAIDKLKNIRSELVTLRENLGIISSDDE
jgi:hypothetical protein